MQRPRSSASLRTETTMTEYVRQVQEAVRAVAITSPTSFTWFGTPSERLPLRVRRAIDPPVARSHLVFTLGHHLYNNFYRLGFASPIPSEGEASVSCQQTQLWEDLSAANCGSGCWEPGWIVHHIEGNAAAVR